MPRSALLLTSATAALLYAAAVHAQSAPAPEPRASRISPVDPRLAMPPAPMVVPAPRPAEPPARPVTMAEVVEGAQLCMRVVSLQYEVQPRILTSAGWSFMQPREISFLGRPYQMVQYNKGQRSIALMDNGERVVCRLIIPVEDLAEIAQVRAALTAGLGAVRVDQAPGLEALAAGIRGHAPEADFANILVAGGYSIELGAEQRNMGTPPRPYRAVIVTSVPLPPQFQSHAQTSAAQ